MPVIACVLLVTLTNAIDHTLIKTALGAEERLTSASTLVREYFHEQDWPFERALRVIGDTMPSEVMSMLKTDGVAGKRKFLRPSAELLQQGDHQKSVEWTDEQLERAKVILNKMYFTQQSELDVLLMDCKMVIDGLQGQMDENARVRLVLGEATATSRADQLEATRGKKDAESSVESLKEDFESHQIMCHKTLLAKNAELMMAEADYNVALKIQGMSTCDDAQIQEAIAMDAESGPPTESAPPGLLSKSRMITSCRMSGSDQGDDSDDDGQFFLFSGMHGQRFHTKAARFAMQRAAKLALQRDLGKHSYNFLDVTTTATQPEEEMPVEMDPMTEMGEEEPPAPAEVPKDLEPEGHKCNVNAAPNCPLLNDAIATMVGELRDAFITVKQDYEATLKHCDTLSADFASDIKGMQVVHDRNEVALAKAITTIDQNTAEGGAKSREYAELEEQFNTKQDECGGKKSAVLDTMCGIKIVRLEVFTLAEKPQMFSDCDVGDWVPSECSASCAGGSQLLKREVLQPSSGGAECPPLQMEQACNDKPCPVDCKVEEWSGFSACSKDCGGGVMSRSRNVVQDPSFGGEECAATSDAVMCNVDACDEPCVLGDWSDWGGCSKACGGGILTRRKDEISPALGNGKCAHPDSEERFAQKPCNDEACDNNVVCASKVDLLLMLDGSGSVGNKGFRDEKTFAKTLLSRMHYGEDNVKAGVLKFTENITVMSELTFDKAALETAMDGAKWNAGTTNTALALAKSLDMLTNGARGSAQSVVFIVTDGMPNNVEDVGMMAEKVKKVARLVFVAVGKNLDKEKLYEWASFPPEMNVLTANKFKSLPKKVGTFMADICPVLECDETLIGNGQNYIGCQTQTVSGLNCQAWDSKFPHRHRRSIYAKKEKFGLGRNHFCRNPGVRAKSGEPPARGDTIWCYTNDENTRWERCEPRNETAYYSPAR